MHLALWLLVACFAYEYKLVVCGALPALGMPALCTPMLHGVSINHWIETLLYCPLAWWSLHQINRIVFREHAASSRARGLGEAAAALWLYGAGVHAANLVEIWSRAHQRISNGAVYELVYFLDERLSHLLQFIPLFFLYGWFVWNDRLDRTSHPRWFLRIGVGYGIERAVGITEGNSWFLSIPAIAWLAIATWHRYRAHGRDLARAWRDGFFRFGIGLSASLALGQLAYHIVFATGLQPSNMSAAGRQHVVMGALALFVFLCGIGAAVDGWMTRRQEQGPVA